MELQHSVFITINVSVTLVRDKLIVLLMLTSAYCLFEYNIIIIVPQHTEPYSLTKETRQKFET